MLVYQIISVFFELSITPKINIRSETVKERYVKENTTTLFMQAIKSETTPASNHVDDLLNTFNSKISNVSGAMPLLRLN